MRPENPFSPGPANAPPVLAGREAWLGEFAAQLDRAKRGVSGTPRILLGVRGVGKTVLLQQFVLAARKEGFAAVRLTVDPDPTRSLLVQLAEEVSFLVDQLHEKRAPGRSSKAAITSGKASINFGVFSAEATGETTKKRPMTLNEILRFLAWEAVRNGRGVAIMVDELHDASIPDLRAFGRAVQETSAEKMPIVWVGAGLPVLQHRAPEAGATSFTERADWAHVPFLTSSQTRTALEDPVRQAGAEFDRSALDLLVDTAGGYPYIVQVLGSHVWDAAGRSDTITLRHAKAGIVAAYEQLDRGLYGLRWAKCTPREQMILAAIANIENTSGQQEVKIGDVARMLNLNTSQLSSVRERLFRKEAIEAAGHGCVRFTLPGLGASILRNIALTPRPLAAKTHMVEVPAKGNRAAKARD
jgi:AAA ATPase domain